MDTQATESSNSPLDINSAAAAFSQMLDPIEREEEAVESDEPEVEASDENESPVEDDADTEQPETVTIKIDGKDVEVTLDELKKGYQRQADYTRKTMEVSETRKAAEAERNQALAERQQYATKLQEQQVLLQSALQEQQNIDWQQLLDSDPMEYLKQRDLHERRQQAFQKNQAEQQQLFQIHQQEQAQYIQTFIAQQQEELLAKLPEWRDEAKAKAEKVALREYLSNECVPDEVINNLNDHKHVLLARKAMLYDQMMSKAKAAAKKVENLPKKVERAGNGQSQNIDKRGQAFQRLKSSGSIDDAASVFASIL